MYNKLCTRILDSSIWLETNATRIVWITLLAAMDQDGYAHFSAIQNLADRARVKLEEAEKAIEVFSSPDPNSSNPANEGRRVERVPGGFMILNAQSIRDEVSALLARANTARRVKEWRERHKKETSQSCNAGVTPSEAYTKSESKNQDIGQQADRDITFDLFWNAYPKKVKRKETKKVWQAKKLYALANTLLADLQERQKSDRRWKEGFIPDPPTYLRGERWTDAIDRSVSRETNSKLSAVEQVERATRERQRQREARTYEGRSSLNRGIVASDGSDLRLPVGIGSRRP